MNLTLNIVGLLGLPGGGEWIIIALVILILFGGRKIPELMRGLGSGIKEFKKATKDDQLKSEDNKINEPKK
jgi:sec-independent protein translocase protein TatA|tara:strand:- start:9131 stop:9343 length:213 start_codon:yes stop_codon:yes gene_type:complete